MTLFHKCYYKCLEAFKAQTRISWALTLSRSVSFKLMVVERWLLAATELVITLSVFAFTAGSCPLPEIRT
jgi:hypothetical protein